MSAQLENQLNTLESIYRRRAVRAYTAERMSTPTPKLFLLSSMAALWAAAGCAVIRPLPTGKQPMAQANVAGVVVTVPRLDSGDYPGDILDVATAVMVVIENRSRSEILIDPEEFRLNQVGGMELHSIAPSQLALKLPAATEGLSQGPLLAANGPSVFVAAPQASVVRPAPPLHAAPHGYISGWRGSYYPPRNYYYAQARWRHWPGGPLLWGPQFWIGWYGGPWFWPWFYEEPRYYAWSRSDAVRLALPAGRLPAGGRTGGFLYFPKMERQEGMQLVLRGTLREATTQQVLGTLQLPLELRGD